MNEVWSTWTSHVAFLGLSDENRVAFLEVCQAHRSAPVPSLILSVVVSPSGCQEIAEEFRAQEIDGQALLLLKEDHLMSAMNIKLGPALKIYARISMLKDS